MQMYNVCRVCAIHIHNVYQLCAIHKLTGILSLNELLGLATLAGAHMVWLAAGRHLMDEGKSCTKNTNTKIYVHKVEVSHAPSNYTNNPRIQSHSILASYLGTAVEPSLLPAVFLSSHYFIQYHSFYT